WWCRMAPRSRAAWQQPWRRLGMTVLRIMVSARQGPLDRVHPAGVGARRDDPEVAAGLLQRDQIDVGLGGGFLDVAHAFGTMGKLVPEELLCPLAAVGRLCRVRSSACRGRRLRFAAGLPAAPRRGVPV